MPVNVIRPATHSSWTVTKWSMDVLKAFEAPRVVSSRVNDRSGEVTGMRMQVLNIPDVVELTTYAVGDNGEATNQVPAATNQTLTIDQFRDSTVMFRSDYDFQQAVKSNAWKEMQGRALKEYLETYILDLHTSVNAAGARNIAGNITDAELLLLKAFSITNRWPKTNNHLLVSADQMTNILAEDRHSELTFLGDGGSVVTTGKLRSVYGFEPLTSDLVRRVDVSGTTRTINMGWVGAAPQGGAFVKGVQQDITTDIQKEDHAKKVLCSFLFGASGVRVGATLPAVRLLRTTNA